MDSSNSRSNSGRDLEKPPKNPAEPSVSKPVEFSKIVTRSDANNGGGFTVNKICAKTIFPPLDLSVTHAGSNPQQEILVKDVNGKLWSFTYVYRGNPKRYILQRGWSKFVDANHLVAGDTILFLKMDCGELCVKIKRSQLTKAMPVCSGQLLQTDRGSTSEIKGQFPRTDHGLTGEIKRSQLRKKISVRSRQISRTDHGPIGNIKRQFPQTDHGPTGEIKRSQSRETIPVCSGQFPHVDDGPTRDPIVLTGPSSKTESDLRIRLLGQDIVSPVRLCKQNYPVLRLFGQDIPLDLNWPRLDEIP